MECREKSVAVRKGFVEAHWMIAIQKQSLDCKAGEGARSPYATIQRGDLIRRDTEQNRTEQARNDQIRKQERRERVGIGKKVRDIAG